MPAQYELGVGKAPVVATIEQATVTVAGLSVGERFALYQILAPTMRTTQAVLCGCLLFHDSGNGCWLSLDRILKLTPIHNKRVVVDAMRALEASGRVITSKRGKRKADCHFVHVTEFEYAQAKGAFSSGQKATTELAKRQASSGQKATTKPTNNLKGRSNHRVDGGLSVQSEGGWWKVLGEFLKANPDATEYAEWAKTKLRTRTREALDKGYRTWLERKGEQRPQPKVAKVDVHSDWAQRYRAQTRRIS